MDFGSTLRCVETRTRRTLWGVGAFLLALAIVVGVIVYTSNTRIIDRVETTTTVLVANRDIPPGTKLDPLIDAGDNFRLIEIPNDGIVAGAVTNVDQLRGQTTSKFIYQNEQIPIARLGKPCRGICLD